MKEIAPAPKPIHARVTVPGSKSITQRALIAAALADGESVLLGPLASEDTDYTSKALLAMGIPVEQDDPAAWRVTGKNGRVLAPQEPIFLGNNGTATRFLTSVAALGHGEFLITGDERMAERPIGPLIQALSGWGAEIESVRGTGCPPLKIHARGLAGGKTILPEGKSSQYLSSLLLVAPYCAQPAQLVVQGEILSKPYVRMTLEVMRAFGVTVEAADDLASFSVAPGRYRAQRYAIEGDASSASYFWAAAAITGGRVTVANVPSPSLQGDSSLVEILAAMGCEVTTTEQGVTVAGPEEDLQPVDVDMGDCPDVAPTLAVVAAFARGTTVIRNIAHLRIKECDRLQVMAQELAKLGVATEEGSDTLTIHGQGRNHSYHGGEIDTHNDHRIAMSMAVAGLMVPGVRIMDPVCVKKSFPTFWEVFDTLLAP